MSIRESIEKHPVIVFLSVLITGFGAGIGAYKTDVEITGQMLVYKSSYDVIAIQANKVGELEHQIKDLKIKLAEAIEENQWYVIVESVKTVDEAQQIVGELKKKGFEGKYLLKDGSTHIAVFVGELLPRKQAWALMFSARKAGYPKAYTYPQNFVAAKEENKVSK